VSVDPHGSCPDCGSPLARDQRYCLSCGGRIGSRSPQLVGLLERIRDPEADLSERSQAGAPPGAIGTAGDPDGETTAASSGLTLPSAKVSAVLVALFLGFGVILGSAASSRVDDTLAASQQPGVRLVLAPGSSPGPSASTQSPSLPPTAEAQATPSSSEGEPGTSPTGGGASTAGKASGKPSNGSSSDGSTSGSGEGSTSGSGEGSSGGSAGGSGSSKGSGSKLPPVKHVFVVMLDDEPYATVFGPESPAHYLAGTLEGKGALLVRYYAVAHQQLADGIALISGQGPTVQTAQNCPTYEDVTPGTSGAEGQVSGNGCVYPSATQTLADQLAAKHLSWRAYVEGMDEGGGTGGSCDHPALDSADPTASSAPPAGGPYATWSNPFVYFQSLTGPSACAANDVGLSALKSDLSSAKSTPSFAYIAPDRCNDGNPTPCTPGAPAGMGPANTFLQKVVPEILASKAYKENGLLAITVDEAPSSGEFADSSSCCGQPQFPNLPASATGLSPEGGGQVGALLLSPFIKTHAVSQEPYNHFSLLRTIEDLFGLSHLGYAAGSKVSSFEPSLFPTGD
jgi:phosphatidylinositol-3-phosphatase